MPTDRNPAICKLFAFSSGGHRTSSNIELVSSVSKLQLPHSYLETESRDRRHRIVQFAFFSMSMINITSNLSPV